MKKGVLIAIIAVLAAAVLGVTVFLFRDPIADALPIDHSGWETEDGVTRYLDADGEPVTGWQDIDGSRYYFDDSGDMHTGWLEDGGKRYFLSETDGAMVTGWLLNMSINSYYLDEDGAMHTGWLTQDGKSYCFDQEGFLLTGWQDIDGQPYHFGPDGLMTTGWLETDEGRYFFTGEGIRYSGWLTDANGTYYLNDQGLVTTGWQEVEGKRYYLDNSGILQSGWLELEGQRYYLNPDGSAATGWQDIDGLQLYLDEDGALHTGWLEWEGESYYLLEDGTKAVGKQVIDGETYYFTSTGANILLVNRWNPLPDDYEPEELVWAECGRQMTPEAAEAVDRMIADCRAAGLNPMVRSSYRTIAEQQGLLNNKIAEYGYDTAIQIVAIPGTSEHHTGLAIDISDSSYTSLNRQQGQTAVSKWLNEHCWDYGFIVRYPDDTTDITGIIYEPWHYRYVGLELAQELKENGLCLEAYLDQLTNDGTTCGDPSNA